VLPLNSPIAPAVLTTPHSSRLWLDGVNGPMKQALNEMADMQDGERQQWDPTAGRRTVCGKAQGALKGAAREYPLYPFEDAPPDPPPARGATRNRKMRSYPSQRNTGRRSADVEGRGLTVSPTATVWDHRCPQGTRSQSSFEGFMPGSDHAKQTIEKDMKYLRGTVPPPAAGMGEGEGMPHFMSWTGYFSER